MKECDGSVPYKVSGFSCVDSVRKCLPEKKLNSIKSPYIYAQEKATLSNRKTQQKIHFVKKFLLNNFIYLLIINRT